MVTLDGYLSDAARDGFEWGRMDCCTFAFNWVRARTGYDPMERYRGRYGSALGAKRFARDLLQIVNRELLLPPTKQPQVGDVGVVLAEAGPTMAIRTQRGWAVKTASGLACRQFETLAAWAVA